MVVWTYFRGRPLASAATRRPITSLSTGRAHMSEDNGQTTPTRRSRGRLFLAVTPSPEDLKRAANIPAGQCPRRYCWWWRSLAFDWGLTPLQGCTFLSCEKPPNFKNADVPCRRCDSSSAVDHYEPREPHLLEDGFAVPQWYSDAQRRPPGEISYDLVMADDMAFVEGTYRIGGCDWCVFIFSKRSEEEPTWKAGSWDSGVWGVVVQVPLRTRLNITSVESMLSHVLGVGKWERVRGPDSMQLR